MEHYPTSGNDSIAEYCHGAFFLHADELSCPIYVHRDDRLGAAADFCYERMQCPCQCGKLYQTFQAPHGDLSIAVFDHCIYQFSSGGDRCIGVEHHYYAAKFLQLRLARIFSGWTAAVPALLVQRDHLRVFQFEIQRLAAIDRDCDADVMVYIPGIFPAGSFPEIPAGFSAAV